MLHDESTYKVEVNIQSSTDASIQTRTEQNLKLKFCLHSIFPTEITIDKKVRKQISTTGYRTLMEPVGLLRLLLLLLQACCCCIGVEQVHIQEDDSRPCSASWQRSPSCASSSTSPCVSCTSPSPASILYTFPVT